jgi:hypothetical protein
MDYEKQDPNADNSWMVFTSLQNLTAPICANAWVKVWESKDLQNPRNELVSNFSGTCSRVQVEIKQVFSGHTLRSTSPIMRDHLTMQQRAALFNLQQANFHYDYKIFQMWVKSLEPIFHETRDALLVSAFDV